MFETILSSILSIYPLIECHFDTNCEIKHKNYRFENNDNNINKKQPFDCFLIKITLIIVTYLKTIQIFQRVIN